MLSRLFGFMVNDIAIDLGTANTLFYVKGKGVVINEPSVVAVQSTSEGKKVVAVGIEAKNMMGKTPQGIVVIRPLKDGVISDYEVTEQMLRIFMRRVNPRSGFVKPRVIISVPFGITEVECRAVRESTESAGAREVFVVDQPMVAALGANLPINEPAGSMIVDLGAGTTEVGVISMRGVVYSRSTKIGGDRLDEAIVNYIKRSYNLTIGEQTAEFIKIRIGSALPTGTNNKMEIRGRDLVTGLPQTIEVSEDEVREALSDPLKQICEAVRNALERTPPELSSDIIDRGIMLTGGGALIRNIDGLLKRETGLPVNIAPEPLQAVVMGSGKLFDNENLLQEVVVKNSR